MAKSKTNNDVAVREKTPVDRMKGILSMQSVEEQFRNALADSAPLFVASLIDLYSGDNYLQKCAPGDVVKEALKAATLRLPISKALGFAYIVPYKNKQGQYIPTFQIGYRGLIQLSMRTGQYRYINADVVYEGELLNVDKLTGHIDLSGNKRSDKVIGYFAHFETLNGFQKTTYITRSDAEKHAKRFSASYNSANSPWKTDFDAMAIKTCLRKLLGKYGIMSVEMQQAFTVDTERDEFMDDSQGIVVSLDDDKTTDIDDQTVNDASNDDISPAEGPGF